MQDLRLYTVRSVEDSTICNDEKLVSGSTAAYVTSARHFFKNTIFRDDQPWPNVIWAPSNMVDSDEAPNVQISVSNKLCSFLRTVLSGMTAPRATGCRVWCLRFPTILLAEESRFDFFSFARSYCNANRVTLLAVRPFNAHFCTCSLSFYFLHMRHCVVCA